MNKSLPTACLAIAFFVTPFISCKKDGLNSDMAKKIQHRWERTSRSFATDYLDGRAVTWTVRQALPGTYLEFGSDGYFSDFYISSSTKYQYKVDGDKILYLVASPTGATTPQYTDTAFVKQVDDHLLVLFKRNYFLSPAYNYIDEYIDSLTR